MEKKDWGQKSCEKIIFAEEDSLVVATNLDLVMQFWLPKGELISECSFDALNFPKKPKYYKKEALFCGFHHFLDFEAEILSIYSLCFWKI